MKLLIVVGSCIAACVVTALVVHALGGSARRDAARWHQHCAEVEAGIRVLDRAPEPLKERLETTSLLRDYAAQCKQ